MSAHTLARRGFSLIELVIVVVIIGIIAAIAVPRMSRGATGAADSALTSNLAILRSGLDLYQTEHGGNYPTLAKINFQLIQFTDDAGDPGVASPTRIYGPYVRAIPPLPVGAAKGQTAFVATAGGITAGWVYDETNHIISPNTSATEKDARGTLYSAY